jgi:hypothetical protein
MDKSHVATRAVSAPLHDGMNACGGRGNFRIGRDLGWSIRSLCLYLPSFSRADNHIYAVPSAAIFVSVRANYTIAQWSSPEGLLIGVGDSGPGVAEEDRERIFGSFYTTKAGGVGIGLSICRSIIEAHGGRLWADANQPRGAIFKFTLPVHH